jgi:hypothetical protein
VEERAKGRVSVTGNKSGSSQLSEDILYLGGHKLQQGTQLTWEKCAVTLECLISCGGIAPEISR